MWARRRIHGDLPLAKGPQQHLIQVSYRLGMSCGGHAPCPLAAGTAPPGPSSGHHPSGSGNSTRSVLFTPPSDNEVEHNLAVKDGPDLGAVLHLCVGPAAQFLSNLLQGGAGNGLPLGQHGEGIILHQGTGVRGEELLDVTPVC
jgi:hypothetical protein